MQNRRFRFTAGLLLLGSGLLLLGSGLLLLGSVVLPSAALAQGQLT